MFFCGIMEVKEKTIPHERNYTIKMRERQLRMNFETEYLIPEEDSVRLLEKIADEIYETEEIEPEEYRMEIPHDIMMKVIVYGYMNQEYSTRRIEKCCRRDINFMYLLNEYKAPDHSTISRYRKEQKDSINKFFEGLVKKLKEKGEFTGENIFIDGTKLEANANRYTFVWKKSVQKNEEKLKTKISEAISELRENFKINIKENTSLSKITQTIKAYAQGQGIEFVQGKGHRKSAIQKLYERFIQYTSKQAEYDAYNKKFDGRNSFSKTDEAATFMRMKEDHMKNGQLKPGYNVQIAVEGEYIIGLDVSSERSDMLTLIPFLKKLEKPNIFNFKRIIADSGYESEENYRYLSEAKLEAYIKPTNYEQAKKHSYKLKYGLADNMEYNSEKDEFICKGGRKLVRIGTAHIKSASGFVSEKAVYKCESCENCKFRENCTKAKEGKQLRISHEFLTFRKASLENISTDLGKQLRMNRSIQDEGAFGVLKQNYSFRRFLTRGKTNVITELLLLCSAFDINKLASKISRKCLGVSLFELKRD